jgi:hypothetical protein
MRRQQNSPHVPLSTRLVAGAIAGTVATAPMTAVMRHLHGRLKGGERYPLPPREIVGSMAPDLEPRHSTDATIVAHFGYGALCGAGLAAISMKPTILGGIAGGAGIWLASYLGWIPALNILDPATRHPGHRNRLMLFAHLVWGSSFVLTLRELAQSRHAFGGGPLKDIDRQEQWGGQ